MQNKSLPKRWFTMAKEQPWKLTFSHILNGCFYAFPPPRLTAHWMWVLAERGPRGMREKMKTE